MKSSAYLALICAGERSDAKAKAQELQEAVDYFKRALKPAKSLPAEQAAGLWKNYGYAIFRRMQIDPQLAKNDAWMKSFHAAFDRAEALTRSAGTKAAIRRDHKDYEKQLKEVK
jgi:hypothetical protein